MYSCINTRLEKEMIQLSPLTMKIKVIVSKIIGNRTEKQENGIQTERSGRLKRKAVTGWFSTLTP